MTDVVLTLAWLAGLALLVEVGCLTYATIIDILETMPHKDTPRDQ